MTDKKSKDDKNQVTDMIKKIIVTGVGAAFMTEDAIRSIVSDLPLPKDIITGLVQNAKASKEEFLSSVKGEVKGLISKIDISKEVEKVLDRYDFEVNAKISLTKKMDEKDADKKGSA